MKGSAKENFPMPNEKSSLNKGGSISGTGPSSAGGKFNPLNASYDNTPHPNDYQKGATRSGSGVGSVGGKKIGS